jgi:DNA-binding MarR family transcriptional regulator
MLNIKAARNKDPEEADPVRLALVDEIRDQMASMRADAAPRRVRRLLSKSISLTHLHVLAVLRARGPLPVSELASALDVSVASATGIVSRMVERGLVGRKRDAADRRVVTVSLSPGGQTALDQLEGEWSADFERLLRRLTLKELELVRAGFHALHRARSEQLSEEEGVPTNE